MKSVLIIFLLIAALVNTSCTKDMREAFGEIYELSGKLGERFGEGSPRVSIGEKGIGVTFVNSSFNDLPLNIRITKAREIALFVKENYVKIERIQDITVAFGVYRDFGFFEYSSTMDAYSFKVKELNSISEPADK